MCIWRILVCPGYRKRFPSTGAARPVSKCPITQKWEHYIIFVEKKIEWMANKTLVLTPTPSASTPCGISATTDIPRISAGCFHPLCMPSLRYGPADNVDYLFSPIYSHVKHPLSHTSTRHRAPEYNRISFPIMHLYCLHTLGNRRLPAHSRCSRVFVQPFGPRGAC